MSSFFSIDPPMPVMTEQKVLLKFNQDADQETSAHSRVDCDPCEAREGGDPVVGGETQATSEGGEACDSSDEQVVPASKDSPTRSSDPPEHISDMMEQVHLLEHAMNGHCMLKVSLFCITSTMIEHFQCSYTACICVAM